MLPACWDSDMGDKEQGYSLWELPAACCDWTSITFPMKHQLIIDRLLHVDAGTSRECPWKGATLSSLHHLKFGENTRYLKVNRLDAWSKCRTLKKQFRLFSSSALNRNWIISFLSRSSTQKGIYVFLKKTNVTQKQFFIKDIPTQYTKAQICF